VEEIAGVRSDAAKNRWWYFEVNGYRSNVAAERYLIKSGDKIKWLYLEASKRSSTKTPSRVAKAPMATGASCELPKEDRR
jgi:hypothetical protein